MAEVQNSNNPQQARQSTQKPPSTPTTQSQGENRAMEPRRTSTPTVTQYDSPFSSMMRFMNEMDRMFGDLVFGPTSRGTRDYYSPLARGIWTPQVDIFERGDQLVLHADLAGCKQDDVKVNVDNGILVISGERRHEHEHEKNGVYQCERSYGTFQRSFSLPDDVDPGSIQASFENGVLEVTMPRPKQKTERGRQIPIGTRGGRTGASH